MANERKHSYATRLHWIGAGRSTGGFKRHDRSYLLTAGSKPAIDGSSDAVFRGDAARWNPEDLLVASLSACHHLWYMGLCSARGLAVEAYGDHADGEMIETTAKGAGQFVRVTLRPKVVLAAGSDLKLAASLHHVAHKNCFIARSVNFPVDHIPTVKLATESPD
jgi:organic hydroperoxide reductase OsmC/OhrA